MHMNVHYIDTIVRIVVVIYTVSLFVLSEVQ